MAIVMIVVSVIILEILAIEMCMTLTLTFRMGQLIESADIQLSTNFQFIDNLEDSEETCPPRATWTFLEVCRQTTALCSWLTGKRTQLKQRYSKFSMAR